MNENVFKTLGLSDHNIGFSTEGGRDQFEPSLQSINPTTGNPLGWVYEADLDDYEQTVTAAKAAFTSWRLVPAPRRGEIVRQLGDELRKHKQALGKLVSLETGKILAEGEGEVQEMIDICDFAVGLSRQLYGVTTHSERPGHRMYEQWHPMGVVGVISAFNFPVAVWAWNAALAAVCGNTVVWKPSRETPLTAIAVQNICNQVMERNSLSGIFNLIIGPDDTIGEALTGDERIAVVSATGSTRMGRHVARRVTERFGRVILELGGNNAMIVLDDANLELALGAAVFGAVGTAGQRCTTTRRLIVQRNIAAKLVPRLVEAYGRLPIGNPLDPNTLVGPLINQQAVDTMTAALVTIKAQGGEVLCGGRSLNRSGFFVSPAIVKAHKGMEIVKQETFAPILYVIEVDDLDEAISIQNDVPQGLSSAIFTSSLHSAEQFLSAAGSDCGIANVNTGTSGAEIGLAFGGEKHTGGGRESGSTAWQGYMRRQSCVTNSSTELPLAQGITFANLDSSAPS